MATAVIRLKRRCEDGPLDALVLNCKRKKTEENVPNEEPPELSTLLKFAGTLSSQEDDILIHLKKATKCDLEDQFKKRNIDLKGKLRSEKEQSSKNSRYKIVNCFRSQNLKSNESIDSQKNEFIIYDIETEHHEDCFSSNESQVNYVYDLYYTMSDDLGDAFLENYVSMYPYNDELIYGSMRDNGLNGQDSEDDSEDSNAENNIKNDYPDESDVESITEEDMIQAMRRCDVSDLSNDDGEEGFLYGADSEDGELEDVDDSDVQKYGERYARFKAKHKKEVQTTSLNENLYYGDIDEEEYYY